MSTFNFTTHDHELTLREMGEMKQALMAEVARVPAHSPWGIVRTFASVPSVFVPFVGLAMRPAMVGALSLILVVGLGTGITYMRSGPTSAETVVAATDVLLAQLQSSSESARGASSATFSRMSDIGSDIDSGIVSDSAAETFSSVSIDVSPEVTSALASIDMALSGSSNVNDVPLARIVASLASLQSLAETHIEQGVATATDDAVLAFIADKKPLLALLVSTASNAEKLAIHTAASEFILDDVRAQSDTAGVFAESFLATQDYDDTEDLLNDLSSVKAVASAEAATM